MFMAPDQSLVEPSPFGEADVEDDYEGLDSSAFSELDDGTSRTGAAGSGEESDLTAAGRRRRRGRRGRGRGRGGNDIDDIDDSDERGTDRAAGSGPAGGSSDQPEFDSGPGPDDGSDDRLADTDGEADSDESEGGEGGGTRRRRRRRRRTSGGGDDNGQDDPPNTVVHVRRTAAQAPVDEVQGVKGSTRLEAKRQRRRDGRDGNRRRPPVLTEAEFLARREAVDRVMVVRQRGERTQIAILEDGVLVEHYVTKATATSYAGNVYLGKVQNVLPSMEAAFVDIGKGRNAVLYAGEVNWDVAGLEGKPRTIEQALKSGDSVLVQVTKDPVGHKGARLTSQVSLPGRFLVYVPMGQMTGISRKLPDTERKRLKDILKRIVPEDAGVIIRTAAEGASEEELTRDVERLKATWQTISDRSGRGQVPSLLYAEPDLVIRVIRDIFNEDFSSLVVQGDEAWETVEQYVEHVSSDLVPRLSRHDGDTDVFSAYRIDEQIAKAMDRKVWLPSGGSLVIDRTEAMTVVDVNTGKFTGSGGNLEETVTRNNLEAAEEIVRQLRLRDIGGIIVIDFIDMVLESNRDLVLRRLTECLGRDRTKHQVAEVTSLGLVQMTRKRVGQGLLEAFSETCEVCKGRGLILHSEPLDSRTVAISPAPAEPKSKRRRRGGEAADTPTPPGGDGGRAGQPEPTAEVRPSPAAVIARIASATNGTGAAVPAEVAGNGAADDPGDVVVEPAGEPATEPAAEPTAELPGETAKPARRRSRRAASRPAGPPVTVEG
jgi:ribonuclease E